MPTKLIVFCEKKTTKINCMLKPCMDAHNSTAGYTCVFIVHGQTIQRWSIVEHIDNIGWVF